MFKGFDQSLAWKPFKASLRSGPVFDNLGLSRTASIHDVCAFDFDSKYLDSYSIIQDIT